MMWKSLVIAFFVAGVFCDELKLSEESKNNLQTRLTDQCKKVNAEDKVDDVKNAIHGFIECGKQLVNFEDLKKEIDEAKPNGALDEVFKKYCAKTPQLKTCISNLFDGVSPCLDEQTKQYVPSFKNGTYELIDFVCYKDGDRIALFIAEHGPECFTQQANEIRDCTQSLQSDIKSDPDHLKNMSLENRCKKFDELSSCVVSKLETCNTPTPSNMAESLFRYVRKSSPCKDFEKQA